MCLINLFICFSYSVIDFLRDTSFQSVEPLLGIFELNSILLAHCIDFTFEFFTKDAKLVFKLGTEGLQSVVDSLGFRFGEISIGLNFSLDVLEFSFKLLFRLNPFHEHHIVVSVHLDELVIHGSQGHILILLAYIACHIFLNQFLFRGRYGFGFHDSAAGSDKCTGTFHHF